jgi:NAD(P)-dependent dehydrogenase (short-subunit alcohol dehydrogenase family)
MRRILITGANRGIGLEFTRQLLQRGERVFAARRNPVDNPDLDKLQAEFPDQLSVHDLDVRNEEQIKSLAASLSNQTDALDWLINGAAIYPKRERIGSLDGASMLDTLHTNTIAPMLVSQAFVKLLSNGDESKIINVSSRMGSIAQVSGAGSYSYRASKSGLNMYSKVLANELQAQGISVLIIHPGWVKTDMGGSSASLTPEHSVASMLKVIDGFTLADTGRFLQWDGEELPW